MDLSWQLGVAVVTTAIVLYEVAARFLTRRRPNVARVAPKVRPRSAEPGYSARAPIVERLPFWNLEGRPRPALEDSTGRARFLCACCGYPTGDQWSFETTCFICDFEGALPSHITFEVTSAERGRVTDAAKENFRQFGSVITPEERAAYGGALSEDEVKLRAQLRERYDHLLATADPPDATERWEEVDQLHNQLRAAEQRRLDQAQADE